MVIVDYDGETVLNPMHGAEMSWISYALAPTIGKLNEDDLRVYEPVGRYLESRVGLPVRFTRYKSYAETIAALRSEEADLASLGMQASEQAQQDGSIQPLLRVIGKNVPTSTYRSVIVTRSDTSIMNLEMLRQHELALVDEQSTSGYVMPRAMLREANINPDDMKSRILGSHRAVVEAVLDGSVAAGAFHENYLTPPSVERAVEYARLRVLAKSREIPRGPIVVRSSLDKELRRKLHDALIAIHEEDPAAARILLADGQRFTSSGRQQTPTLKSIAALAGVSYVTVSRVVNKSGQVSEESRKRIEAIVEEVGYAPNGNARVLLGRELPLVAMVVSMTDHASLARVEQLRTSFEAAKLPLLVFPAGESLADGQLNQILRDRRIGAVIVFEQYAADPVIRQLAHTGFNVLAVTERDVAPGVVASSDHTVLEDVLSLVADPRLANGMG